MNPDEDRAGRAPALNNQPRAGFYG